MNIHWLPLTLDQVYIYDIVREAAGFGVTGFHLSHRIVHNADDLVRKSGEARLAQVYQVLRAMRDGGFEVWSWTHEVLKPPAQCVTDGALDLGHPALAHHLQEKYRQFFQQLLPGLSGIVLTFAETQYQVYKGAHVTSPYDADPRAAALRTRMLTGMMADACRACGKRLAIRDFVYRAAEIDAMLDAVGAVDDAAAVMSKWCPHDWHPYYPENPVLGRVGGKQQWVEFDPGHEYELQTHLTYAMPEMLLRRVKSAAAKGIDTVCLRLDRYGGAFGDSAIYKPWGRLELDVFRRYAEDPQVTVDDIISGWEQLHFPGAWEIVAAATEITNRMLFPKRLWYADHSRLPAFDYARTHLKGGNADRLHVWTGSQEDARAADLCDRPTAAWYASSLEDARRNHRRLQALLKRAEELGVTSDAASQWRQGLANLVTWEEMFRLHQRAYFAIRLRQNDPSAISRAEIATAIDDLEGACARFAQERPHVEVEGRPVHARNQEMLVSLRDQL